jgi:hypothetical protein
VLAICLTVLLAPRAVAAQQVASDPPPPNPESQQQTPAPMAMHDMSAMSGTPGWHFGFDGNLFATFDDQGSERGQREFRSQNWFMTMASHALAGGTLTLTGMLSAEPFTVGPAGYSEIFQEGEAFHGLQVTDHQHPHNLFMQLAGAWRVALGKRSAFTVAGGPVGEAALGPIAFMHRPSSADNPTAPLSHHIFDSTHVSEGVVTVRADVGPWALEASAFHGREPDEHRYDIETGRLDSWSTRVWFKPGKDWLVEASHGFLYQPEQLEPGDQRRTNAAVSWFHERSSGSTAATLAVGWNQRTFSTVHAVLAEFTHRMKDTSFYGRFEDLTVETEILLFPEQVHRPHVGELVNPIQALTLGAVRDISHRRGFEIGIGGDVTVYGVPALLQIPYGTHPTSFHIFLRVRPPSVNGRMWNATMADPMMDAMAGHMAMDRR